MHARAYNIYTYTDLSNATCDRVWKKNLLRITIRNIPIPYFFDILHQLFQSIKIVVILIIISTIATGDFRTLQMIVFFIILSILTPGVISLLGYDCGGTTFNVTSVSLLRVGECRTLDDQPNSTTTYIQLLQVAEYSQTRVYSCRIEIDRQVFYCGMHSHISLVHGGHRKYLVDLDQSACARLHNTRTFVYGQDSVVTELQPNTTNYRTLMLAGSTTTDGACHGGQFGDAYGTWNNALVEASIYITFKDYYASVKSNQDLVLLRSGKRCLASELACIDEDGSNVFWSPLPDDKCQFHAYDVLYQGFANKIVDTALRYPIVYSLTSDKATFALSKKSERTVCGYTLIQTEHPKC